MYFKECQTISEAQSLYRELCKKNHPDVGGDIQIIQKIIAEYKSIAKKLSKNAKKPTANKTANKMLVVASKKQLNVVAIEVKKTYLPAKKEPSAKMKLKKQMLSLVCSKAKTLRISKQYNASKALKSAWSWYMQQRKSGKIRYNQVTI